MFAWVTRGSTAPCVQAGSGRPAWMAQPVALLRAGGDQVLDTVGVGATGTIAMSVPAAVGTVVTGASVGATAGGARAAAGVQAATATTVARIMPRTSTGVRWCSVEVVSLSQRGRVLRPHRAGTRQRAALSSALDVACRVTTRSRPKGS